MSFVDILRWFWEAHDTTSGMGQGNARGTQYRSGFYWFDDEQKALIEASKAGHGKALGTSITTETAAAADYDKYGGVFYYGEDYHQQARGAHRHALPPPPHALLPPQACSLHLPAPYQLPLPNMAFSPTMASSLTWQAP